jgi:glycosyltransferase involved in cell wall biosynthesis
MPLPRTVFLLGNYLSGKGFSRGFIEELADHLTAIGWDCIRASDIVWKPARLADMMQTSLRTMRRVSVVHIPIYSGAAFIWAAIGANLAMGAGTPLVVSLHGGNLPRFSKRWPKAVRQVLGIPTKVVAPSRYLQAAMRPVREDIELLPNPIDLDRYAYHERNPVTPRLIWLRAFHAIYNPTLAPRMLAVLRQRHPDVRLIMIGSDKGDGTRQATERLAHELGVANHIEFQNVIPKVEVPLWLQKGDIFINTADIDNTPVSVLEAMACGLSVVTTNVGGIPDLLADGRDALLVPRDDPSAMAAAVSRVLEAPDLARYLARAARAKVDQMDWKSAVWRWDKLLLDAASHPRCH